MNKKEEIIEDEFIKLMVLIQATIHKLDNHMSIRVERWIEKLAREANPAKKANRNRYIKLLYSQIIQGRLVEPFDALPDINESLPRMGELFLRNRIGDEFEAILCSEEVDNYIDSQLKLLNNNLSDDEGFLNDDAIYEENRYEISPSKNETKGSHILNEDTRLGSLNTPKKEGNISSFRETNLDDYKSHILLTSQGNHSLLI